MYRSPRELIGFTLGRASRLWRTRMDERLGPLGLTQARWLVLVHLSRAGGAMPQKELAERIGVEGPTLVRVLDGLERTGFIERRGQDADRRAKVVHLVAQSSDVVGEIVKIAAELREEILDGVAEEDLATCMRVLTTIVRNMEGGR